MNRPFDALTIGMSHYLHHEDLDGVDEHLQELRATIEELGGSVTQWTAEPKQRHAGEVASLLAEWVKPASPRSSMVIWIGHGEAKGRDAWLATYDTQRPMRGTGIHPEIIAEHIINEWRRRAADDKAWFVVVIEACGAEQFVRQVASILFRTSGAVPQRLAIVGAGGTGATFLGSFHDALRATLDSYTDNDQEIQLKDLLGRLEDRLTEGLVVNINMHGAAPLPRQPVLPEGLTGPMNVYAELREYLQQLPPDERSHFVPRAQGAEQGELAWYFVGRRSERTRIARWLNQSANGMLIVTGRAGSGKSALLGNVLVHTHPVLLGLLRRVSYTDEAEADEQPQAGVFDAVIHLTGITPAALVHRIAAAAGLEQAPDAIDTATDWLVEQLRPRRFTLLVDALDEAQEPVAIAGSVLRRLAALPRGRVVVGTRASTGEGPDQLDTPAENLLDALGRSSSTDTVVVDRDSNAIATYVDRRLTNARRQHQLKADAKVIQNVAQLIADQQQQFLFARLAVHEILARPQLLSDQHRNDLKAMLQHDHRAIFESAVQRLTASSSVNFPLLEALALARGRGLPRADRIWAMVAEALGDDIKVTEADIDALIHAAAPYIMLDSEDGQSVHRLAHRTFSEFFEFQARRE